MGHNSWLIEKSEMACHNAARLCDKIKQLSISEDEKEHLYNELHPMLYNLTKIVASANGVTDVWKSSTAKSIINKGTEGFKLFMARVREFSENGGFIDRKHMIPGDMDEPL